MDIVNSPFSTLGGELSAGYGIVTGSVEVGGYAGIDANTGGFVTACLRVGPAIWVGAQANQSVGLGADGTGTIPGWSVGVGGDIGVASKTLGGNLRTNFRGGSITHGPGYGYGFSVGVEGCYTWTR